MKNVLHFSPLINKSAMNYNLLRSYLTEINQSDCPKMG